MILAERLRASRRRRRRDALRTTAERADHRGRDRRRAGEGVAPRQPEKGVSGEAG